MALQDLTNLVAMRSYGNRRSHRRVVPRSKAWKPPGNINDWPTIEQSVGWVEHLRNPSVCFACIAA
jgi:hypothetical protein